MAEQSFEYMPVEGGAPVKMWTKGVAVDPKAREQLSRAARMPFVFKHVAAMPDVHIGIGATVGSVIPTKGAVIPAAVGVDIGCGMMAARTSLVASDLPDTLEGIRSAIEQAVPHGRDVGRGKRDKGSWGDPPAPIVEAWATLAARFERIVEKYPKLKNTNNLVHLGTLGTGNHFIELCLDQDQRVWVMRQSDRGVPHGRDVGRGKRDKGSWGDPPAPIVEAWATLAARFERIVEKYPKFKNTNNLVHLGTLGTGNHFIELCLDQDQRVWVMLH